MPLQSSGQISLNEIHVEAGGSNSTEATVNDTDIRSLISASSQQTNLSFSQFYGASAGVLSTEVEEVLPSAVQHKKLPLKADDDTEYGVVEYDQLTAILIEAVKELSARVKELENASSK